ncbi:MAG: YaeQ family protein [Burkholderiaceae bacterium]|nr:YaeQ family protein [Burkholderiaceae bacterium]
MALKATIYKAALQVADIDRNVYADHALTVPLQPSETEERLMARLLAFALNLPADDRHGMLQLARGMADADEPDLWHKDLSDQLLHWIEVGQPDERRLARACGKARRVTLYCYSASAPIWFAGIAGKITRLRNLEVWQLPAEQSQALAGLAQRSMQLQFSIQDGHVYVGDGQRSVEVQPKPLWRGGQ